MSEEATTQKSVGVHSLSDPSTKIAIICGDIREEAALVAYVYTLTESRRPKPSVEPEKSLYRGLRAWKDIPVPDLAVQAPVSEGSPILFWDGKKSLQGDAPWGRPAVGAVVSPREDGALGGRRRRRGAGGAQALARRGRSRERPPRRLRRPSPRSRRRSQPRSSSTEPPPPRTSRSRRRRRPTRATRSPSWTRTTSATTGSSCRGTSTSSTRASRSTSSTG